MSFHPPSYEDIVNSKYATAMPAPAVVAEAKKDGDPVDLLESFVE